MMRKAAFLAVALATAASPCLAEQGDTQTAIVSLQGINMNSDAGSALLHARMRQAVRAVCGDADNRDLVAMADLHACRTHAMQEGEALLQAALGRPRQAPNDSRLASAGPNP